MNKLKFPNSLADVDAYNASSKAWAETWAATDEFVRRIGGWTSPWLDESWRDGNPIFSAWSKTLRRGLRIIQHDDPSLFSVWRNTFGGRGSADAVDELVVSCALTDETIEQVRRLMFRWLRDRGGVVNSGPHPRGPLDFEPLEAIEPAA